MHSSPSSVHFEPVPGRQVTTYRLLNTDRMGAGMRESEKVVDCQPGQDVLRALDTGR